MHRNFYPPGLLCFLFSFGAQAQPTLVSTENAPVPGETYTWYRGSYVDPGAGGGAVVSDFSSMVPTDTVEKLYVAAGTTPNGNLFNTATVASDDQEGRYIYLKASSVDLQRVGEDTLGIQVPYSDGAAILPFPCTIGSSWVDPYAATYSVSGLPFTRTGVIRGEADGYGQLQMPLITLENVLRVRTNDTLTNTSPLGSIDITIEEFAWYKTYVAVPLMIVRNKTLSINGGAPVLIQETEWVDSLGVGLFEHARGMVDISLFPSPAQDLTMVRFMSDGSSEHSLEVIDAEGRILRTERLGRVPAGIWQEELDLRDLVPGHYLVRITTSNGAQGVHRLAVMR
ncbi:MAG: T9SS type A sorting domain-containing protein [Flavobacteriales bacterium]|nr:T9SS type A sorting domain-containing protein [Flavobacteriales bacterium]